MKAPKMIFVKSPWFLNTFCGKTVIGFSLFCFLIYRDKLTDKLINHETIHWHQCLEMLVIPFWLTYFYYIFTTGYWNSPFEKEAYNNDKNLDYLKTRKPFAWWKYR